MDREYSKVKQTYNRYVIDDGWSEDMPKEVVETVDLRPRMTKEEALELVIKEHNNHKGAWIDENTVRLYRKQAKWFLPLSGYQYIGAVRELGEELQEKYGVTEEEAINILRGYHLKDYVNKYYRIKNLIPLNVDVDFISESEIEEIPRVV